MTRIFLLLAKIENQCELPAEVTPGRKTAVELFKTGDKGNPERVYSGATMLHNACFFFFLLFVATLLL